MKVSPDTIRVALDVARFIRDTYDWLEYKLKERSEKAKQLSERYGPTPEGPLP